MITQQNHTSHTLPAGRNRDRRLGVHTTYPLPAGVAFRVYAPPALPRDGPPVAGLPEYVELTTSEGVRFSPGFPPDPAARAVIADLLVRCSMLADVAHLAGRWLTGDDYKRMTEAMRAYAGAAGLAPKGTAPESTTPEGSGRTTVTRTEPAGTVPGAVTTVTAVIAPEEDPLA